MINSNNLTDNDKLFRRLALLTVAIIYLLILAGGIVRSTGSGMGCPDWPRCFGRWVPPTDVTQLPANYKEIYSHRGYADTAFNAVKTWIEYVNRLLGVLTGFFIFFTFVASLRYLNRDRLITALSFLALILVGVQGWLGSVVVKTVLNPWVVTAHMVLALIIVGLLLYVVARTYAAVIPVSLISRNKQFNRLLFVSILLLLTQIILGTQVRQMVDQATRELGETSRGSWLDWVGLTFYIHRSFSLIVLGSQLLWFLRLKKVESNGTLINLSNWVLLTVMTNVVTGIVMAYFSIPSFAQPLHLTLAVVALGIQFVIMLLTNREQLLQDKGISAASSVVEV